MTEKILYIDVSASVPSQHKLMADQFASRFEGTAFDFDFMIIPHRDGCFHGGGTNFDAVVGHSRQNPAKEYHVVTDGLLSVPANLDGKWFWYLYPGGQMPDNVPGETGFLQNFVNVGKLVLE